MILSWHGPERHGLASQTIGSAIREMQIDQLAPEFISGGGFGQDSQAPRSVRLARNARSRAASFAEYSAKLTLPPLTFPCERSA